MYICVVAPLQLAYILIIIKDASLGVLLKSIWYNSHKFAKNHFKNSPELCQKNIVAINLKLKFENLSQTQVYKRSYLWFYYHTK